MATTGESPPLWGAGLVRIAIMGLSGYFSLWTACQARRAQVHLAMYPSGSWQAMQAPNLKESTEEFCPTLVVWVLA